MRIRIQGAIWIQILAIFCRRNKLSFFTWKRAKIQVCLLNLVKFLAPGFGSVWGMGIRIQESQNNADPCWPGSTTLSINIRLMQSYTVRYNKLNLDIICEDSFTSRLECRCRDFRLAESRPPFSCLKAVDKPLQPGSELTHRLLQLAFTAFPV